MTKLIPFALVALSLIVGRAARAGTVTNARIIMVRVDDNGLGLVSFDVETSGRPACGNPIPGSMSFNTNQTGGRALLQLATSAKLSGATVTAYGRNVCNNYSANVEDMGQLELN